VAKAGTLFVPAGVMVRDVRGPETMPAQGEEGSLTTAAGRRPMEWLRLGAMGAAFVLGAVGYAHEVAGREPWYQWLAELVAGCGLLTLALHRVEQTDSWPRRCARWLAGVCAVLAVAAAVRLVTTTPAQVFLGGVLVASAEGALDGHSVKTEVRASGHVTPILVRTVCRAQGDSWRFWKLRLLWRGLAGEWTTFARYNQRRRN
jgi:hypothetical protein